MTKKTDNGPWVIKADGKPIQTFTAEGKAVTLFITLAASLMGQGYFIFPLHGEAEDTTRYEASVELVNKKSRAVVMGAFPNGGRWLIRIGNRPAGMFTERAEAVRAFDQHVENMTASGFVIVDSARHYGHLELVDRKTGNVGKRHDI